MVWAAVSGVVDQDTEDDDRAQHAWRHNGRRSAAIRCQRHIDMAGLTSSAATRGAHHAHLCRWLCPFASVEDGVLAERLVVDWAERGGAARAITCGVVDAGRCVWTIEGARVECAGTGDTARAGKRKVAPAQSSPTIIIIPSAVPIHAPSAWSQRRFHHGVARVSPPWTGHINGVAIIADESEVESVDEPV
jgi:hypothetical protein